MDNKYFTKYLPVKGEIYQMDMYYDSELEQVLRANLPAENYALSHLKKVKLFLCSRDIQVGDKYYDNSIAGKRLFYTDAENSTSTSVEISPWEICDSEGLREYLKKSPNSFKVIGEISPDVLSYVKEGQKYEEDEVAHIWSMEDSPDEYILLKDWEDFIINKQRYKKVPEYLKNGIVAIKGPCGHFH